MAEIMIRVENSYECGRESEHFASLALPTEDDCVSLLIAEQWLEEEAFEHTGDGHDCGADEGAIYRVVIVDAPDELVWLVDLTVELGG